MGFTALSATDESVPLDLVRTVQEMPRQNVADSGGTLVKFTGDGALAYGVSAVATVGAAYIDNYEPVRSLKREWDPDNLFRHNHNITPD